MADTRELLQELLVLLKGDATIEEVNAWASAAAPADDVTVQAVIRAIYNDTNELQGDWTDGGRLDLLIDSIITALGSELDGTPDLYDVLVDGYATAPTPTVNGSVLEKMEILLKAFLTEATIYTSDSATVNSITDSALTGTDDFYNGYLIIPLDGTYQGQARYIYDYDGTNKILYVTPEFTGDPDSGGAFTYIILPLSADTYYAMKAGKGLESIFDTVDGALELSRVGGDHTMSDASSTEDTLYIQDSPSQNLAPSTLVLDLSNLASGDTLTVKVYYRLKSGGSYVEEISQAYSDAQSPACVSHDLHENRHGFKVTLTQSAGTARDIGWEVYYLG